MIKRTVLFTRFPFLFIPGCLYRNPCKDKATLEGLIQAVDGRPEDRLFVGYLGENSEKTLYDSRTDDCNLVLPLLESIQFEDVTDKEEIKEIGKNGYIAFACIRRSENAFYFYPDYVHASFYASQGGPLEDWVSCNYYNYKRIKEEDGKKIFETIKAAYYKGYEHLYKTEESNPAAKSASAKNNMEKQTSHE